MQEKVIAIISDILEIDPSTINESTNLTSDLKIDSLDLVDLVTRFESEFSCTIADKDLKTLQTVKDIITYIENHTNSKK
jgi:acyl carrier protein